MVASALVAPSVFPNTQIVPQPFAPPTAGNSAFATWYSDTFPKGVLWANPYDIVPNAFENLPNIKNNLWGKILWPALGTGEFGPSMPSDLDDEFNKIENNAQSGGYTQPSAGLTWLQQQMPTQDEVQKILTSMNMDTSKWQTWEAQLIWQHFPPAYYILLEAQGSAVQQPYPLVIPSSY